MKSKIAIRWHIILGSQIVTAERHSERKIMLISRGGAANPKNVAQG